MAPALAKLPPTGPEWLHEIKFDGWRTQLHVEDGSYTLYSKNGADFTKRFRQLAGVVETLQVRRAIIDCELIACDESGMPCFQTLMTLGNRATLCLVAFDLLMLDGVNFMNLGIEERKAALQLIVKSTNTTRFQFSDGFDDPIALLEACSRLNFEGIVSKRRGSLYKSGPTKEWLKLKTAEWRATNRRRWELFQK
ncbi:hypothetical protein [Hyphomicrobium sp. ghe19]|uniref:ATP-dependent DNA ligase n=1 Tax=Hyphomicrobium sp. ghe19 TaxID=2682968 RepID=UPI0013675154|nr:hypothetical protein HYPP_02421 [Hyphomicrobium sp. ghe19]